MPPVVAAAVAIGATAAGAAIGAAVATGVLATAIGAVAGAVIAIGANKLLGLTPKAPKIARANIDRLNLTVNSNAPRVFAFGETALATDVRYHEWSSSTQEYLGQIVYVASHAVHAVDEIWFDTELAWSASGGVASKYSGYLTITAILEGTAGNAVSVESGSVWNASTCRAKGIAYLAMRYKLTGNSKKTASPFASAIPNRVTVRGRGAKLYDPRRDSTAGGSGTMRANDQSTWAYAPSGTVIGRNPALQLLWFLLGWKISGKLAVARGFPVDRIDLASFAAAANICDESVTLAAGGTEPRYRADGLFSEEDDPETVLTNLLATMNGVLRDDNGKLALYLLTNDLAAPVCDFTDDDVLGEFTWEPDATSADMFNIVRGQYTDSSDQGLYSLAAYPDVAIASVDGIERAYKFDLPMVHSVSQAQRLAKTRLQRAQYPGVFTASLGRRGLIPVIGSVVRLSFAATGFVTKIFRVQSREWDMATGAIRMVLREDNAAIYAWAAEESPAVVAAVPATYNPANNPARTVLDGLIDSNTLTVNEKITRMVPEEAELESRYQALLARGTALGITTTLTAATAARTSWLQVRNAISPAWDSSTADSVIVRSTINSARAAYVTALDALDKAISEKDATLSEWVGVTERPPLTGQAVSVDEFTADLTRWTVSGAVTKIATPSPVYSQTAFKFPSSTQIVGTKVPVDLNAQYMVRCDYDRSDSPNGGFYLGVALYRADGTDITGDGDYWLYKFALNGNASAAGTPDHVSRYFGAGTAREIPADAVAMAPLILGNRGGTQGFHIADGVRIEKISSPSEWQNDLADDASVDTAQMIIAPGVVRSHGYSATGWTRAARTKGKYNNVRLSGKMVSAGQHVMMGLTDQTGSSYSYGSYCLYVNASSGTLQGYSNGSYFGDYGSYTINDTLAVEYDGGFIYLLKFAGGAITQLYKAWVGTGRSFWGAVYMFGRRDSGFHSLKIEPARSAPVVGFNTVTTSGAALAATDLITNQGISSGIIGQAATATDSGFSAITGATKPENNADVSLVIAGGKTVQIPCLSDFTVKTGVLPMDANFKMTSGASSDVTTSTAWSRTVKSGTVTSTIGAATGILNITAISSDAVIEVSGIYGSKTRTDLLTIIRKADPVAAPVGVGTSDSDATITSTTSSSYGAANTSILKAKAGTGGTVQCSMVGSSFTRASNGTGSCFGKWQWRVVGGSFADITSEIASTVSAIRSGAPEPANDPGEIQVNMIKTGLTAGTEYEFQLLMRSGGSYTIDYQMAGWATGV